MSEELEWVDLARLVDEAEDFILRREASWSLDSFTKNVMEDVIMELRFLSIFFGYFGLWSLAPSAAPPSSRPSSPMSHLDGDEMDSLLIEVSAIGEELDRFFQHPLFDRFSEDPQQKLIAKLVNLGRSVRHPFRSKRSKLLRVLIPLRDSIASVQSRARYVYQGFSLSRLSFHLQPNWSETEVDYDWKLFRFLLEKNLTCFKYQSSEIDSLFKTLRRILDSLDWLLTTSRSNSGNTNNYPRWPPWKENVMAHQFIGMLLHVAHCYCLCCLSPSDGLC
ncbi:OLC1v1004901C1 [Oldenlandia corymbosa var. corymbosa]|uniref:OLC1v1004901C1 n=1 Tax=Oldenlandia corymbosa var. corymbosa TaxID=529605 RepID=A0AAV1DFS5_OLDCO|nr:OLC1v1004901C1 [Oldenlandia corymbosa var. corymbosa]